MFKYDDFLFNKIINKIFSIVFLLVIFITIGDPLVVNGKEPVSDLKDNVIGNNGVYNRGTYSFIKVMEKSSFKKDGSYYTANLKLSDDASLLFEYDLINDDVSIPKILINDKEYYINNYIDLVAGDYVISFDENTFTNFESLNVETTLKPVPVVHYKDDNINVSLKGVVTNSLDMKLNINFPSNFKAKDIIIPGVKIDNSIGNSKIVIDRFSLDEAYDFPVERLEDNIGNSQIVYNYTYSYGVDTYEDSGITDITGNVNYGLSSISAPSTVEALPYGYVTANGDNEISEKELIDMLDLSSNENNDNDFLGSVNVEGLDFPVKTDEIINSSFTVSYEGEDNVYFEENFKIKIGDDKSVDESYATNTAYATDGTNEDQGTGVIGVEKNNVAALEYKINALSHEVILRVALPKNVLTDGNYSFNMTIQDESGNSVSVSEDNTDSDSTSGYLKDIDDSSTSDLYEYEIATGSLEDQGFDRSGKYTVSFSNVNTVDTSIVDTIEIPSVDGIYHASIAIDVPETILYKKDISDPGTLYSAIGDGVNSYTDVDNVSDVEAINPNETNPVNTYGIYELESIGYEDANNSSSSSTSPANWGDTDLTLTKYDHIIRPMDSNYIIKENIDGSQSKSSTSADVDGGFGSDGYRPIGQVIGTVDGDDSIEFQGMITGNIDELDGASVDNTYINNIYLTNSVLNNMGIVAKSNSSTFKDLGVVNPSITGGDYTGTLTGSSVNTVFENVYVMETVDDSDDISYDIFGDGSYVGGISGYMENSTVNSTGDFRGVIPGIDLSTDSQPSVFPDKDGYKTFTNVDIKGSSDYQGGIAGCFKGDGIISNSYAKGTMWSDGASTGGIVGYVEEVYEETLGTTNNIDIYNTYYSGNLLGGTSGSIFGGIVGTMKTVSSDASLVESTVSSVRNSYSTGSIENSNNSSAGIVGEIEGGGSIYSTYSMMTINGSENIGGIANVNDGSLGYIKNNYYIGNLTSNLSDGLAYVGGVVGNTPYTESVDSSAFLDLENNFVFVNMLTGSHASSGIHVGSVLGEEVSSNSGDTEAIVKNNYYLDESKLSSGSDDFSFEDSNYSVDLSLDSDVSDATVKPSKVTIGDISSPSWWSSDLFVTGAENYNIVAGDVVNPNPDKDTLDESADNKDGTVSIGSYPTVKEINADYTVNNEEVLEQGEMLLPVKAMEMDYKIDAQTLDLYVKLENTSKSKDIKSVDCQIKVSDGTTVVLTNAFSMVDGDQVIVVKNTGWVDGDISKGAIQPNKDYNIELSYAGGMSIGTFNIHTPKQVEYSGKTYAMIGDGINAATDVDDAFASDKIEPGESDTSTTFVDYGIYELESIGYEASNGTDLDSDPSTANTTDWSEEDLTLAKYDHIIRPIDANYLVASNIDGSHSSTVTTLDNVGGFGSDGYRPIGQVIGTTDGEDSFEFKGEITGDVDSIIGSSADNTYVSSLYISQSLNNVGMVSLANGAQINNLGIIDPSISGNGNIGSFGGEISNSVLLNVYAIQSNPESGYSVVGNGDNVGGLFGYSQNTQISSDGVFKGEVPGIDLGGDIQPNSLYPDKDGYKTFNTLNVQNILTTGLNVGGIVGEYEGTLTSGEYDYSINNVYNKGDISGINNVGGISGNVKSINIFNVYNMGSILAGDSFVGGLAGISSDSLISNSYNTGNIEATSSYAGGIIGEVVEDGKTSFVYNSYNVGDVTSQVEIAGGIVGGGDNVSSINISNTYNLGTILSGTKAGGIIGGSSLATNVSNSLNVGDITASNTDGIAGGIRTIDGIVVSNCYVVPDSTTAYTVIVDYNEVEILFSDLSDASNWSTYLFKDGASDNFNINVGDASLPSSNSDTADESEDNADGTVVLGHFPTVKELDVDGSIKNKEVLEQSLKEIPVLVGSVVQNFKIDAMTLDLYLKMQDNSTIDITINDGVNDTVVSGLTPTTDENGVTNIIKIDQTQYDFEQDKDYLIKVPKVGGGFVQFTIHTPKQVVISSYDMDQDGDYGGWTDFVGNVHSESNVVFALIGDGVNVDTDVDSVFETASTPSTVQESKYTLGAPAYGIYELESIAYEAANSGYDFQKTYDDVTGILDLLGYPRGVEVESSQKADWTETDLTLYKYDHIIRPTTGNYLMAGDIDGTPSKVNTELDVDGGFSSVDKNGDGLVEQNGFRPIAEIENLTMNTASGYESWYSGVNIFEGVLTGDRVHLYDSSEQARIRDIYINKTGNEPYTGLFSWSEGVLECVGILSIEETTPITGSSVGVGPLAAKNDGFVRNSYSNYDVDGDTSDANFAVVSGVGGLIGESGEFNDFTLIENSYATGDVWGANQSHLGGLIGILERGSATNNYATGDVSGTRVLNGIGGLVGTFKDGNKTVGSDASINYLTTLENNYSLGDIDFDSLTYHDTGTLAAIQNPLVDIENNFAIGKQLGNISISSMLSTDDEYFGVDPLNSIIENNHAYSYAGLDQIIYYESADGSFPDNYFVSDSDLILDNFYLKILGWSALDWEVGIKSGEDTCFPQLYSTSNDGTRVPDQECEIIPTSGIRKAEEEVEDVLEESDNEELNSVDVSQNQKGSYLQNLLDRHNNVEEELLIDDEFYPSITL